MRVYATFGTQSEVTFSPAVRDITFYTGKTKSIFSVSQVQVQSKFD